MKQSIVVVALLAVGSPGLRAARRPRRRAEEGPAGQEAKQKFDDLTFTEEEERQIGEDVSAKIRQRFGVVQDPAVHKYVTLVGTVARAAVGAAEAAVDVHRARHRRRQRVRVARRVRPHHARRARADRRTKPSWPACSATRSAMSRASTPSTRSRRARRCKLGTDEALSDARRRSSTSSRTRPTTWCSRTASTAATSSTPTRSSSQLTQKAGYAPASLGDFLTRLDERNKDQAEQNGLFASHPETKERIDKIRQWPASRSRGARRTALQDQHQVPADRDHVDCGRHRRLRRSGRIADGKEQPEKKEEPKKGFGLGGLEADRRAGKTDRAGVGFRRRPRSRRRSRREGRQQPEPGEGHGLRGGARRVQEGDRLATSLCQSQSRVVQTRDFDEMLT